MKDKKHMKSQKGKKHGYKYFLPDEKNLSATPSPAVPVSPIYETNIYHPTGEIIPAKPVHENMETHSHHLHNSPGHGWKHYLFEFFMLFLAVTLGFFMENQREHFVENKRAKNMALSVYNDLKADTAYLEKLTQQRKRKLILLDSLMNEMDKPALQQRDTTLARLCLPALHNRRYFLSELGTYEQIKNSGGLRYYKMELQKALVHYEAETKGLNIAQELEHKPVMEQIMPFLMRIQNPRYVRNMLADKPVIGMRPFNAVTEGFKDDLYNYAIFIKRNSENLINIMKEVRAKATELMLLLEKEYHLK